MKIKTLLLITVLCIGIVVGGGTAGAHWIIASGNNAHIQDTVHRFLNEVNSSGAATQNTRDAQIDWHNTTVLDLSSTSNHDASRFHALDNNYGNDGSAGTGEYCFHCGHLHTRLNQYYSAGTSRTVACQEIGHNVGADHHADDCMGYSYFSSWSPYVGAHSRDETASVYAHVFQGQGG